MGVGLESRRHLAQLRFDHLGHLIGLVLGVDVHERAVDSDDPVLRVDAVGGGLAGVVHGLRVSATVEEDGEGQA